MKKLLTILLIALLPFSLFSQEKQEKRQLFRAGILAGFNVSQVEGDGVAGYNKLGANGGATAFIHFHEHMSVSFEILYSMKGSKRTLTNEYPQCSYKLVLDYIDVPILFNYHDTKIGIFSAGLSVGNLIRTKEFKGGREATPGDSNPYNSQVLEGVVSVTFMITDNLGLNLRGSYTLGGIGQRKISANNGYDIQCRPDAFGTHKQFNNVLTMRGLWRF